MKVVATQADRDAAADFDADRLGYSTPYQQEIRAGLHDDHKVVKHFAAHRQAALEEAAKESHRLASPAGGEVEREAQLQALWTAHRQYLGTEVANPLPPSRTDARKLYGMMLDALSALASPAEPHPIARVGLVGGETAAFQSRVQPWMMECFGAAISADLTERCDRFIEEAFELVQALGYDPARLMTLASYTFDRPVGEPSQEVGGVMVTLAALCLASNLDMHEAGETELARINVPETIAKIRAKQAAKAAINMGSPLPDAVAIRALGKARP